MAGLPGHLIQRLHEAGVASRVRLGWYERWRGADGRPAGMMPDRPAEEPSCASSRRGQGLASAPSERPCEPWEGVPLASQPTSFGVVRAREPN